MSRGWKKFQGFLEAGRSSQGPGGEGVEEEEHGVRVGRRRRSRCGWGVGVEEACTVAGREEPQSVFRPKWFHYHSILPASRPIDSPIALFGADH